LCAASRHLFADRTAAATMRAHRLRLWFTSMLCALRRFALQHTQFAKGTYGTRKLLKLGALVPPACGASHSP